MLTEGFAGFGILKLLSCELQDSDGNISYPYGKDASGLVVIDAKGYFSVHVLATNRQNFRVPDLLGGTAEEVETAFKGYIGYYGTLTIDEVEDVIITHVKGASFPNCTGTNQVRHYEFNGDRMTLSAPSMQVDGRKRVGKLIWERVK